MNSGSDYYYRARQYSASSGRFSSLDPIGFISTESNLYRSFANQPVLLIDPSGLANLSETVIVENRAGVAAVGGLIGGVGFIGCTTTNVLAGGEIDVSDFVIGFFGSIIAGAIIAPLLAVELTLGALLDPALGIAATSTICGLQGAANNAGL